MGGTGIEPDVQDVVDLFEIVRVIIRAQQIGRRGIEPGIRARRLDGGDDAFVDRLVPQGLAGFLVHEQRNGHAPGPLAGEHPIA